MSARRALVFAVEAEQWSLEENAKMEMTRLLWTCRCDTSGIKPAIRVKSVVHVRRGGE